MAATAAIVAANRRKHEAAEAEKLADGTPRTLKEEIEEPKKPKKKKKKVEIAPTLPYQKEMFDFYQGEKVQIFVALLIVANFIFMVAEKEYDPFPDNLKKNPQLWITVTTVFNVIFLIELFMNWYGSVWYKSFFKGGWNIFDSLIVFLGTVSLFELALDVEILPPSLGLLRPFRAFRVFRLFKKVPSLAKIMSSLAKAVPGVANAFLIMVIIMCIYAILAVEFFKDFGNEGTYVTTQDHTSRGVNAAWALDANGVVMNNATVSSMTARGFTFGEEYYGTFMRALYTLFQVLTGESWSEAVARPTMFGKGGGADGKGMDGGAVLSGIFYVTFIIIMQIVMLNVVVAVLLEKMVEEDPVEEEESDDEEESSAAKGPETGMPTPVHMRGATPPPSASGAVSAPSSEVVRMPSPELPRPRDSFNKERASSPEDVRMMQTQLSYMQKQLDAICSAFDVAPPPARPTGLLEVPVVAGGAVPRRPHPKANKVGGPDIAAISC